MVLSPADSFEVGDRLDNMANALPAHTIELDAFYIDIYEVTVFLSNRANNVLYDSNPQWLPFCRLFSCALRLTFGNSDSLFRLSVRLDPS